MYSLPQSTQAQKPAKSKRKSLLPFAGMAGMGGLTAASLGAIAAGTKLASKMGKSSSSSSSYVPPPTDPTAGGAFNLQSLQESLAASSSTGANDTLNTASSLGASGGGVGGVDYTNFDPSRGGGDGGAADYTNFDPSGGAGGAVDYSNFDPSAFAASLPSYNNQFAPLDVDPNAPVEWIYASPVQSVADAQHLATDIEYLNAVQSANAMQLQGEANAMSLIDDTQYEVEYGNSFADQVNYVSNENGLSYVGGGEETEVVASIWSSLGDGLGALFA